MLLDTGADIALYPNNLVPKGADRPFLEPLAVPVLCFPFNRDPSAADGTQEEGIPIQFIYNCEVEGFGLLFHFPLHVYPGDISEVIAGKDFLKVLGGAPVPHRSKALVELTDEEDTSEEDLPSAIAKASERREFRGLTYRKQPITTHCNPWSILGTDFAGK